MDLNVSNDQLHSIKSPEVIYILQTIKKNQQLSKKINKG